MLHLQTNIVTYLIKLTCNKIILDHVRKMTHCRESYCTGVWKRGCCNLSIDFIMYMYCGLWHVGEWRNFCSALGYVQDHTCVHCWGVYKTTLLFIAAVGTRPHLRSVLGCVQDHWSVQFWGVYKTTDLFSAGVCTRPHVCPQSHAPASFSFIVDSESIVLL
jgi:hypothetical protein